MIVDIRSDREKANSGVPDLPFGGRLVECEYAQISDRRLRGQLRSPKDIERQVGMHAPSTHPHASWEVWIYQFCLRCCFTSLLHAKTCRTVFHGLSRGAQDLGSSLVTAQLCMGMQVTVLEIASLKQVRKGTRILLLDGSGGTSKRIAKELSRRGFRNVYVIDGGFSGWTSQKLQTKGSSTVSALAHVHFRPGLLMHATA